MVYRVYCRIFFTVWRDPVLLVVSVGSCQRVNTWLNTKMYALYMSQPPRIKNITPIFKYNKKLNNLNKTNFEIVISRYDEDITWSDNYKEFRTIYNKGLDNIEGPYIKLENKGHLADTILKHIVTNYNNLANVTFFTHGSFNYRNDQLIKHEGKCHKYFSDFIQTGENVLVCIKKPHHSLPQNNARFYNYPKPQKWYMNLFLINLIREIFRGQLVNGFL